ncbi:MAG: hypothetical protein HOK63_04900 [Thaumarchaeota archaeon]|jgi:hypothetical protein|nr:hypothetical protein [Nitrososphaerota archaeon]MBT6468969.1 hypothetical protein [Nitrososphaerota archaeon]
MFLIWKLIFQNISTKNLILIVIGIVIVVFLLSFSENSCGIQHMKILNDINSYEQSLDPEICEIIVEKIDLFNDECSPYMEILDCG